MITRNEFIATTAAMLMASPDSTGRIDWMVNDGVRLAQELEQRGLAPWKDAAPGATVSAEGKP